MGSYLDAYSTHGTLNTFRLSSPLAMQVKHMLMKWDDKNQIEFLLCDQGQPVVYLFGALMNMNTALLQLQGLPETIFNTHQFILINPPGIGHSRCTDFDKGLLLREKILQSLINNIKGHIIAYSMGCVMSLLLIKHNESLFEEALFFVPPSPFDKFIKSDPVSMSQANKKLLSIFKYECKQNEVVLPEIYTKAFLSGEINQAGYFVMPVHFMTDEVYAIKNCRFSLIHGTHDAVFDTKKSSAFYKKYLGNRLLQDKFINTGHFLSYTHQKLFVEEILFFFGMSRREPWRIN